MDRKRVSTCLLYISTNRIELVLALHVVLDEHDVVHCFLQLERVLFAGLNVTHRLVQSRHNRRQAIVSAQSTETTAQGAHQTAESDCHIYERGVVVRIIPSDQDTVSIVHLPIRGRGRVHSVAARTALHVSNGIGTGST